MEDKLSKILGEKYAASDQVTDSIVKDSLISTIATDEFQLTPDEKKLAEEFLKFAEEVLWHLESIDKKTVPYEVVNLLVHSWSTSSANNIPISLAMQLAAREEFDPYQNSRIDHLESIKIGESTYNKYSPLLKKFIKGQYNQTQKLLLSVKGDYIIAYRGMRTYIDPSTPSDQIKLQPISSFSLNYDIATQFAGTDGTVLMSKIPKENVLSTFITGVGCLAEDEVTVLGNQPYKTFIITPLIRKEYYDKTSPHSKPLHDLIGRNI